MVALWATTRRLKLWEQEQEQERLGCCRLGELGFVNEIVEDVEYQLTLAAADFSSARLELFRRDAECRLAAWAASPHTFTPARHTQPSRLSARASGM